MFGLRGCAFRFGNVVGPRQTHGVGFDFVRRLRARPDAARASSATARRASRTSTSSDVVSAVLLAGERGAEPFGPSTSRPATTSRSREIADLAVECLGLPSVRYEYTGGDRGWKGDVPVVRLDHRADPRPRLGCSMGSADALRAAMLSLLDNIDAGLIDA